MDIDNRVRVSFQMHRGKINQFVMQYEAFLNHQWRLIIRYDTAHGFAHADQFHPGGKREKIPMPTKDYNEALTMAQENIKQHWEEYRKRYMEEQNR